MLCIQATKKIFYRKRRKIITKILIMIANAEILFLQKNKLISEKDNEQKKRRDGEALLSIDNYREEENNL